MYYSELVKRACTILYEAHRDDLDKGGYPYVFHPFYLAAQMDDEATVCTALLHDVSHVDYEDWFSASDALMLDYHGGAKLFGRRIGAIEEGACADVTIIDIENILWQPVNDMTRQLVYYENGSHVDTVIVAGRKVLEHGRSLFVDEDELIAEAKELCAKLRKDCAGAMALVEKQIPYMRGMYLREIRRDIGFNRFIREV